MEEQFKYEVSKRVDIEMIERILQTEIVAGGGQTEVFQNVGGAKVYVVY